MRILAKLTNTMTAVTFPTTTKRQDEEREARLEAEQKERDMNGIRQNMYKDRLQESIEKVCRKQHGCAHHAYVAEYRLLRGFLDRRCPEEIRLWVQDEDGYDQSIWDINLDLPLSEIVKGIKDSLEEQFGNIYYNTNRMEYVYKLICAKDPSKFMPSEKDVKKEYDRQKERSQGKRKIRKTLKIVSNPLP